MKKNRSILFFSLVSLISLPVVAKNYEIEEYQSNYLGESFTTLKPMAYISGVSYCDDLEKNIAYNTSCLKKKTSKYKLTELENNCNNCIDSVRMIKPRKLHFKEKTTFEIVDSFKTRPSDWSYRVLNSNEVEFLVLKDTKDNYIEMLEIEYELMKKDSLLSREEKKIMAVASTTFIVKPFCFMEQVKPANEQLENVKKLVKDFELNDSVKIEPYNHCRKYKGNKAGFNLITKDFNSFLTINYYLNEWNVYGDWY